MSRMKIIKGNFRRSESLRALLTDTAPHDLPIIVSNDGVAANLRNFSLSKYTQTIIGSLIINSAQKYTIPIRYRINQTGFSTRQLSLSHPAAQLRSCQFYELYGHLIPYFCRNDDISIRRPASVGVSVFRRGAHSAAKRFKHSAIDLLTEDTTVRNPASYFSYSRYSRLHKFYESDEFLELERKYGFMRVTDIAKCFPSIYTHTLAWALKTVNHGKENTAARTFANDFDKLMQFANFNETNGIPVGWEVSRIFCEIILQAVDRALVEYATHWEIEMGRDFIVRRYIDDYCVFARSLATLDRLEKGLLESLAKYNLHLSERKTKTYTRPLQLENAWVVARVRGVVGRFLTATTSRTVDGRTFPRAIRRPSQHVRRFLESIRTECAGAGVSYAEVAPYVMSAVANACDAIIGSTKRRSIPSGKRDSYVSVFEMIIEIMFFMFSVHPTVPGSYQLAKWVVLITRSAGIFLEDQKDAIYDIVRKHIQERVDQIDFREILKDGAVPVDLLNILFAAAELPAGFEISTSKLEKFVHEMRDVDYFTIVALLHFFGRRNAAVVKSIQAVLEQQFAQEFFPAKSARDIHLSLDVVSCPYLSHEFRRKCVSLLLMASNHPKLPKKTLDEMVKESEINPWFVNWRQVDLLMHLRKKELIPVY